MLTASELATTLARTADEIDRIRGVAQQPKLIEQQALRALVPAIRALLDGIAVGLFEPEHRTGLLAMHPHWQIYDGQQLLNCWRMVVIPWLASEFGGAKYGAGQHNYSQVKRDKDGNFVVRDGRVVTEWDELDDTDRMFELQIRYRDWADVLRNAAAFVAGKIPATDATKKDVESRGKGGQNTRARKSDKAGAIPPRHRTRRLSKAEAARYLGIRAKGKGEQRSKNRVAILTQQMERQEIAYIKHNRQSYTFDIRDFPERNRPKVAPDAK